MHRVFKPGYIKTFILELPVSLLLCLAIVLIGNPMSIVLLGNPLTLFLFGQEPLRRSVQKLELIAEIAGNKKTKQLTCHN